MRSILLFSLLSSFLYGNDCIKNSSISKIAQKYTQLRTFIDSSKEEICVSSGDIDEESFKIARSLEIIKDLEVNPVQRDERDALTYEAISEKDWWTYLTRRSNVFKVDRKCKPGVIAYIISFLRGRIHLCERFFDLSTYEQASVLMHEVRHFDGHRHVTCTQGAERGSAGACDEDINNKGSYAISVQSHIAFMLSEKTPEEDRLISEGQAIFTSYNKFNKVPKVKLKNVSLLFHEDDSVYFWDTKNDQLNYVQSLDDPSYVHANASGSMTNFPVDLNLEARRFDRKFIKNKSSNGLFADHYNKLDLEEREKIITVNYRGVGAILRANKLMSYCGKEGTNLSVKKAPRDKLFTGLTQVKLGNDLLSLAITQDGNTYKFSCNRKTKELDIVKSNIKAKLEAKDILDTISVEGRDYALTESGVISELKMSNRVLSLSEVNLSEVENNNWLSIGNVTIPYIAKDL